MDRFAWTCLICYHTNHVTPTTENPDVCQSCEGN